MAVQVAISHQTKYRYDRPIVVNTQTIRLRPAPHCRIPIDSYSLNVSPENHLLNWQQAPLGNIQARVFFPEKVREIVIDVDLVADLTVINPFDFFLEPCASHFPFCYDEALKVELRPFLEIEQTGAHLRKFVRTLDLNPRPMIDFLVDLNRSLHRHIRYEKRDEPGIQDCEETLSSRTGSCRDTAWLLVRTARLLGLAARFASGYLVQLKANDEWDDPETEDSVDLHAWAEIYLPGAGWIGLDPTSGLLTGEGHIPLASGRQPENASPISGRVELTETEFEVSLSVERIHQVPPPNKPFPENEWQRIMSAGREIDNRLDELDVRLTMGGEPTFVSDDDRQHPQWRTQAIGCEKLELANELTWRLANRFASGGLVQYGQGKQYAGEVTPRWALRCFWRADGEPIWRDCRWQAAASQTPRFDAEHAQLFAGQLAKQLRVDPGNVVPALESAAGDRVVGYALPLQKRWWQSDQWQSALWSSNALRLLPGTSAMGYRLPLEALAERWEESGTDFFPNDPYESKLELPTHAQLREPQSDSKMLTRSTSGVVRQALCVEHRGGTLYVFIPPMDQLENFLELITAIEAAATTLRIPVSVEGYAPPADDRLHQFSVTPDPGVIEVNMHPAANWDELVDITTGIFESAMQTRLSAERFESDGTPTSSGGGSHIVLGGATPAESPFLRRPDLLKSLIAYWHNHPSLSYFFAGRFVGPTGQAPRIDEGHFDSVHELEMALEQLQHNAEHPPWYVDRVLRGFLTDRTGNRHRSEFCIDKLYAPECINGRLGLLELRAFAMAPHARMSLVQQLLVRALIARFWDRPYEERLVDWGSTLHDRFMLPYFLWQDLRDVIEDTQNAGLDLDHRWFEPQYEFRFPKIGSVCRQGVNMMLRTAIEPWYVVGEDSDGASRYVDSSLQRVQITVQGLTQERHVVTCNGRRVPLQPTGIQGEFIAGIRFRAWQPPSCTHPTIPVDAPITVDLVDTWLNRSLGGCRYYVSHPAGRQPDDFPVNASEAESRRDARFVTTAHTSGRIDLPPVEVHRHFPVTLDLRTSSHLSS